jgi:hypothetical protein
MTHGGGVARPESSTGVIRWPWASFHAGLGAGGGLYLADGRITFLELLTQGHTKDNYPITTTSSAHSRPVEGRQAGGTVER